jgi:hypothetical protein
MGRIISFALLAVINIGVMVVRMVDAVVARGGGPPRFSLLIPMWVSGMMPESRTAELIALAATPGISLFLPVLVLVIGIIDMLHRRKAELSTAWSKVLIATGCVCLLANAVTTYLIFTAMPSFE